MREDNQLAERPTVAVYYFPNYHADARNASIHGPGWTEWELVRAARPRWPGHKLPRVPLWGETDEADPGQMAQKIDAAADHGVDVFVFDWYCYDDGPFLQRALDEGFMQAHNRARLKLALMWANHDWIDIHPAKRSVPPHLNFPGNISRDTWPRIVRQLVDKYFSHPSYWRPAGMPYFSIYEINRFIECMGGLAGAASALDELRQAARAAGFPDIHVNAVVWAIPVLPGESGLDNPRAAVSVLDVTSVTSYVWVHHVPIHFPVMPYEACRERYEAYRESASALFSPIPYHPNVTMGWDPSPRTVQTDVYDNVGYPFMGTLGGNTPAAFRLALQSARDWLAAQGQRAPVLTINAWNEWTEGSYLEPDQEYGTGYLEAIREVFGVRNG